MELRGTAEKHPRTIQIDDGVSRYEYADDQFNRRLSATKYAYEGGGVSLERFLWHGDCEIGAEVYWNKKHDEWVVTLGDGTRRPYARTEKHRRRPASPNFNKVAHHIKEELLPSGNRRWYHYDDDKELKLIQTVSSDEKHVVHFVEFHRKHDSVDVTTSEGLSTRFSLKKLRDDETAHVVDGIERASKGKFSFSYCDKSSRHTRRIEGSAVRTPDAITQSSTTKERTPLLASGTG